MLVISSTSLCLISPVKSEGNHLSPRQGILIQQDGHAEIDVEGHESGVQEGK